MKKILILLIFLCISSLLVTPAHAHPADMYSHTIHIHLTSKGVTIKWEIKSGPMLASSIWNRADTNQDGAVSQEEAGEWGATLAPLLSATLDGKEFTLELEKVDFPVEKSKMQAGITYPVLSLSADWPKGMSNEAKLYLSNHLDDKNSLNWFGVSTLDPTVFHTPIQNVSRLEIDLVLNRNLLMETSGLLSNWDSNTPVLQTKAQSQKPTSSSQKPSAQEILTSLVKQERFSFSFYFLALGISLILGALHALTPGHGKTVVAAYLVGARGTTRHAILLGSIVTLTHTGSVLVLGAITLVASRYILPNSLIPALEILSGLLIVGLGIYLLTQRLNEWRHIQSHFHNHAHEHDLGNHHHKNHNSHHHHEHEHEHISDHHHHGSEIEHGHTHEIPDTLTWRSLVALGVSGGLVPCPDAIAILLVAIALNRILLGLALIISFSLGLAIVLIAIGLIMVHSRKLFDRWDSFKRFAPLMPVVSAVAVLLLGVTLTYGAAARFMSEFNFSITYPTLEKAQIVYLADDQNKHQQLFLADANGENPKMITQTSLVITDYALSPDQTRLIYFLQTKNIDNEIWLINIDGTQNHQIGSCLAAMCRQPVWSPDGQRVLYENINLHDGSSSIGIPTLWWFNLDSGKTQPVFQEVDLPVLNPRWSPNGAWLSYTTPEGIHLYRLENGESRLIKNRIGSVASWATNSRSIIIRDSIENEKKLVTQLFRYDLISQQLTPFAPDLAFENLLVETSPTGMWIAIVRRETVRLNENQIWLIRADGSEQRLLTTLENGYYSNLSWSPDGKYLLYDMYIFNTSTLQTHLQKIDIQTGKVSNLGIGFNPSWVWSKISFNLNATDFENQKP